MPSCFWNFLSLISAGNPPATNIQTHINLYKRAFFSSLILLLLSSLFLFLAESLICWITPPSDRSSTSYLAPDRIIWGILGGSCVDVWLACESWSSCGSYGSSATKQAERTTLHSILCGSALINNEVTVIYGDTQVCMREGFLCVNI